LGCKKKQVSTEPELPAATMEGKNTFGCRFGNQVWVPGLLTNALTANFYGEGYLNISCARRSGVNVLKTDDMYIRVKDVKTTGIYSLITSNSEIVVFLNDKEYTQVGTGTMNITFFNSSLKIIAGTFSLRIKDRNSIEIIDVTDGRFDLNYK
jgi:hypothetical protein